MIKVGDFCTVLDSGFAQYGVRKGDLVYIAGDTVVNVGEDDPYELRRIFVAAYTNGGVVDVVKSPFTIDGMRLKAVSKKKQADYEQLLRDTYGDKEPDDDNDTTH